MTNPLIHPSAIVSPDAEIASDVEIGAFAIIGENCSIASGCVISARATLERNVSLAKNVQVGIGTILGARRIVLIATGTSKARCVERMLSGPVTPAVPASFLQLHQDVEIWLDAAAASRVRAG